MLCEEYKQQKNVSEKCVAFSIPPTKPIDSDYFLKIPPFLVFHTNKTNNNNAYELITGGTLFKSAPNRKW